MPLRFKLGGRLILSAHLNVETAGSERKRPSSEEQVPARQQVGGRRAALETALQIQHLNQSINPSIQNIQKGAVFIKNIQK